MSKNLWRARNAMLDPETDFTEIYRNLALYDFPWDTNQALSFALFRTYAVPSIGRLLDETGQFTGACQKRYDDTALLLEASFASGFESSEAKTAIRRVNQMHRTYAISDDDLRYVLATFVVVPKRARRLGIPSSCISDSRNVRDRSASRRRELVRVPARARSRSTCRSSRRAITRAGVSPAASSPSSTRP